MLSARNVIAAALLIAVVSLVGVLVKLAQPPDSGGLGRDTYGTRAHGLRALYEVLEELSLPTRRALVPPSASFQENACIVFWAPDARLVQIEPGHLRQTAQWIREGGRVVLAPSRKAKSVPAAPWGIGKLFVDTSALAELGLPDVSVASLDELASEAARAATPDSASGAPISEADAEEESAPKKPARNVARRLWYASPRKPKDYRTVSVSVDGELAFLGESVSSLRVPADDLCVIDPSSKPVPSGRVFLLSETGVEYNLVATYALGDGEIVVVSDPELFLNRSIAEQDNAVLAVNLLGRTGLRRAVAATAAQAGRRAASDGADRPESPIDVDQHRLAASDSSNGAARPCRAVFDEFYHGLTIRGNPVWLLTRHPYGLFVALLAAATALWVWRERVHLGPPLPASAARRRNIGEYVAAMARLFHRSGHRRFILREVKGGTLWALRKRLHLGPAHETPEDVAKALARRDPEAAEALRSASAGVDAILREQEEPGLRALVRAAEEMTKCL